MNSASIFSIHMIFSRSTLLSLSHSQFKSLWTKKKSWAKIQIRRSFLVYPYQVEIDEFMPKSSSSNSSRSYIELRKNLKETASRLTWVLRARLKRNEVKIESRELTELHENRYESSPFSDFDLLLLLKFSVVVCVRVVYVVVARDWELRARLREFSELKRDWECRESCSCDFYKWISVICEAWRVISVEWLYL